MILFGEKEKKRKRKREILIRKSFPLLTMKVIQIVVFINLQVVAFCRLIFFVAVNWFTFMVWQKSLPKSDFYHQKFFLFIIALNVMLWNNFLFFFYIKLLFDPIIYLAWLVFAFDNCFQQFSQNWWGWLELMWLSAKMKLNFLSEVNLKQSITQVDEKVFSK